MKQIPRNLESFFWDIKIETFNPLEYPQYTISRILELGNEEAINWIKETFSESEIKDVIALIFMQVISSRGTKRDFVDLYVVAQQYNLSELFNLFKQKYSLTPYNNVQILKSLTYFNDAESEPIPDMILSLSWNTDKHFFTSNVPKLL